MKIKKSSFLLICSLFNTLLISQQQVSDLQTFGVQKITEIGSKIGFAQVENEDYMLIENDSLSIFKWNVSSFEIQQTIEPYKNQKPNGLILDPNRSRMEIRDGKYYRFYHDALQIIDIVTGEIEFLYDGELDGFNNIYPEELLDSRLYFQVWENGVRKYKLLDINTGELLDKGESPPPSWVQIGDQQIQLLDSVIILIDLWTGEEKLNSFFPEGITYTKASVSDTSFLVMNGSGKISKLNQNGVVFQYECVVKDVERVLDINFSGERMILLNKSKVDTQNVDVIVIDMNTCVEEQRFTITVTSQYAEFASFVSNDSQDEDFSIIGMQGLHPSDLPDPGFFYIIDHRNRRAVKTPYLSGVLSFTPFKFNNSIYFIGYNSSFWTGAADVIFEYHIADGQITNLVPEGDELKHATLGYFRDGQLFCATNTINEKVKVWQVNEKGEFNELMSLSFSRNAGVTNLSNIKTLEDKIYFTTPSGLYSLLDHDELILPVESHELLTGIAPNKLNCFEEKISFVTIDADKHPQFHVYDRINGDWFSYVDSTELVNGHRVPSAGPFYFYSNGKYNNGIPDDTLKIFDVRDGSLIEVPEAVYPAGIIEGENFAFFWDVIGEKIDYTYSIDYKTKAIDTHELDIESLHYVVSAELDVQYLIDYDWSFGQQPKQVRIRRINSKTDIETIYDGHGSYVDFEHDKGSDVSYFILKLDGPKDMRIVVDDTKSTVSYDTKFVNGSNHRDPIVALEDDKAVLVSNLETGIQFRVLKAFEGIKDIDEISDKVFIEYADVVGDQSTYVYFKRMNDSLNVMTYNVINEASKTKTYKIDCNRCWISETIRLDDNSFLMSLNGQNPFENEPRIINIETDSIYVLADLNIGSGSSYPGDFLRYKDWIYFTAMLKEGDRQWFRLNVSDETTSLESVDDVGSIYPYPNPSEDFINLSSDFQSLIIFSMDGKELLRKSKVKAHSEIDISQLHSGTFILLGIDEFDHIYSGKLVKI